MSWNYPYGQCTYYCATHPRTAWSTRYGNLHDGRNWGLTWEAYGGYTSTTPAAWTVVCFQPGVAGAAAPYGHVAVVETVGPGWIGISEMNFTAGLGRVDRRTVRVQPGMTFLYENGASRPPAPSTTVTGAPEPMTGSQKRAMVRLAYLSSMGREPESQAAEDWWAAQIKDDDSNVDSVIPAITDSAEARAYLRRVQTAIKDIA